LAESINSRLQLHCIGVSIVGREQKLKASVTLHRSAYCWLTANSNDTHSAFAVFITDMYMRITPPLPSLQGSWTEKFPFSSLAVSAVKRRSLAVLNMDCRYMESFSSKGCVAVTSRVAISSGVAFLRLPSSPTLTMHTDIGYDNAY
jgi:hypothetical protein